MVPVLLGRGSALNGERADFAAFMQVMRRVIDLSLVSCDALDDACGSRSKNADRAAAAVASTTAVPGRVADAHTAKLKKTRTW